ncbi:unnamed protein product [Nezara viridula]|uniref:Uncharacterized protein n=1 Tax=Nezara viridula TaxID=85310 RepID=A0A9P0GV58_NEZVI|nr:unnamed protein product [Nezara viridula]
MQIGPCFHAKQINSQDSRETRVLKAPDPGLRPRQRVRIECHAMVELGTSSLELEGRGTSDMFALQRCQLPRAELPAAELTEASEGTKSEYDASKTNFF